MSAPISTSPVFAAPALGYTPPPGAPVNIVDKDGNVVFIVDGNYPTRGLGLDCVNGAHMIATHLNDAIMLLRSMGLRNDSTPAMTIAHTCEILKANPPASVPPTSRRFGPAF